MLVKLKRHIRNFLRFSLTYLVLATLVEIGRNAGILEHYALIRAGLFIGLLSITGWFGWRFYTGMYRDGDFPADYRRAARDSDRARPGSMLL
jgi:hypothetical protein